MEKCGNFRDAGEMTANYTRLRETTPFVRDYPHELVPER